jgi:dephospho-CoA kinase
MFLSVICWSGGMRGIVLGLSGQIASGKSTIARALTEVIRCERVSFGGYVRKVAASQGYNEDRRTLQDLGQDLIEELGAEQFCIEVLRDQAPTFVPGKNLVIEGIRHAEVVEALSFLVQPSALALVFVQVDERTRRNRLALREGEPSLEKADEHDTEQQVRRALQGCADLTLVSTRPSGELVRKVLAWMRDERALWESGGWQ